MSGRDEKVIFAFAPADSQSDNIPLLTFIMPEAAWAYMRNGLGHEFDLTNVGIPLRVLIGRTKTYDIGIKELTKANGGPMKDAQHVDMHFGKKPDQ